MSSLTNSHAHGEGHAFLSEGSEAAESPSEAPGVALNSPAARNQDLVHVGQLPQSK